MTRPTARDAVFAVSLAALIALAIYLTLGGSR